MKAISLLEPWAALVAIGAKRLETRSWQTSYRGPLAIHASKGFPGSARLLLETEPFRAALAQFFQPWEELPRGGIVAVCQLTQCVETTDVQGLGALSSAERAFGDFGPGRWAWRLEDVRRLWTPIVARGALGLWEWDPPAQMVALEDGPAREVLDGEGKRA